MTQVLTVDTIIARLEAEVRRRGDELAAFGNLPHLAIVVAGEDPAVRARARARVKYGNGLGMAVEVHEFPTQTSYNSLMKTIRRLSGDSEVDGILVESPLPDHLSDCAMLDELNWEKDVSGFHPVNLGKILSGQEKSANLLLPIQACLLILEQEKLSGRRVTVLCGENEVGRALVLLFLNRGATVTVCPPNHPDLGALCRSAEILVTALNQPGVVQPELIAPDALVIDVGQTMTEQGMAGDLEEKVLNGRDKTVVSGGIERLVPVLLFRNLVAAAEKVRESGYGR